LGAKSKTNGWILTGAAINIDPEEVPRDCSQLTSALIMPASGKEFI